MAVLATCNEGAQLAAALRAPGCLDHTVALPAPGASERTSMQASHIAAGGEADALPDRPVCLLLLLLLLLLLGYVEAGW